MKFVATGDSFITCNLPNPPGDQFEEIRELIAKAHVRFTNLEVTTHDFEGYPSAFSGGTWAIASPSVLNDIKSYGFNLLNIANNHTMDYSSGGLKAMEKHLSKYDFVYGGAGENMAKASDPKYLSTQQGRVGFIAATSTFHESWIAGEQKRDVLGRPGVNPLRFTNTHIVSRENMDRLKEIAAATDINAMTNLNIKEGFEQPHGEDSFKFGGHLFKVGDKEGLISQPNPKDLDRILSCVKAAKSQGDQVVVSIHSHEMKGEDKEQPADFLIEFARACIDSGATAVLGHGPHILRGIEIYKDRPIFYSLGNFIFQTDLVNNLPYDFYEKYGVDPMAQVATALDKRSKDGKVGLGVNPKVWESVVASWTMDGDVLESLELTPITLGFGVPRHKRGWPRLSQDTEVLQRLAYLSKPFGTNIKIENKRGILERV